MSVPARLLSQDNIIRKVFDETLNALTVTGSISVAPTPGAATEAKQDAGNASLASIDTKLTSPIAVTGSLSTALPEVYAVTALIDTAVTNITNSGYLQLVANTSQITKKLQVIEDIGEFMAIYVGPASSEVLLCALPLGGGEVEVNVPANSRLSIRSLNNNVIQGKLIVNLLK